PVPVPVPVPLTHTTTTAPPRSLARSRRYSPRPRPPLLVLPPRTRPPPLCSPLGLREPGGLVAAGDSDWEGAVRREEIVARSGGRRGGSRRELARAGSLRVRRVPRAKALALSPGGEILGPQQQPEAGALVAGAERPPPTAMAGSDEVNRNECKKMVPKQTFLLISQFKVSYHLIRRADGTFDRHLAEFLDRRVPPDARAQDGVSSFDHVIDPSVGLEVRIYRASAANEGAAAVTLPILDFLTGAPSPDPFPVIVFFHGGSFAHSSSSTAIYDNLCRQFVKLSKGVVLSVNYRRAPEHRYPCAYEDGWTALKWAVSQPFLRSGEGAQPRVFLSGDSSGGNIAHHVAVRAADAGIKIYGNILLNAMFGGTERTQSERWLDGKYFVTLQDRDWYWKAYLPEGADRDHPACNPFGPNGRRLAGIPFTKSLIIVSGLDLTCDRQLAYAKGLREDGHHVKLVYREMATIGFYLLPNTDHYHEVMEEISDFLRANLS
ncbi:unnamed protein product, partial [Urochloa humidicola]